MAHRGERAAVVAGRAKPKPQSHRGHGARESRRNPTRWITHRASRPNREPREPIECAGARPNGCEVVQHGVRKSGRPWGEPMSWLIPLAHTASAFRVHPSPRDRRHLQTGNTNRTLARDIRRLRPGLLDQSLTPIRFCIYLVLHMHRRHNLHASTAACHAGHSNRVRGRRNQTFTASMSYLSREPVA